MHYFVPRQPEDRLVKYDDGSTPPFPEQLYNTKWQVYLGAMFYEEALGFIQQGRAIIAMEVYSSNFELHEHAKQLLDQKEWQHMSLSERLLRAYAARGSCAMLALDDGRLPTQAHPKRSCRECDSATPMFLHLVPITFGPLLHHVVQEDGKSIIPSLSGSSLPEKTRMFTKSLFSAEEWKTRVMWQIDIMSKGGCTHCHSGKPVHPTKHLSIGEVHDMYMVEQALQKTPKKTRQLLPATPPDSDKSSTETTPIKAIQTLR